MSYPRSLCEAEDWIRQLFNVLDNLNWNGGFCEVCRRLYHHDDLARRCGRTTCKRCPHECTLSSDDSTDDDD